jgi:hypothetical protein
MPTTMATRLRAVLLPLTILVIAACGGPTAAADHTPTAPPASPDVPAPIVESPAPVAQAADPGPVATPDPAKPPITKPVPKPKPVPVPTTWSRARVVFGDGCFTPAATVDGSGRFHVAAGCGMNVRYASSKDGRSWSTMLFKHPAHRFDVEPQVAVDGSTLYVAFTRLRPTDGGCGDDGLSDVGVFYRTRQLPSGVWSAPVRIGNIGDHLQSFRVANGVIHETVLAHDGAGPVMYGSLAHGSYRSIQIPDAIQTSLRVGDDGRARIAYSTGPTLRYAIVGADGQLSSRRIFDGRGMELTAPNLVLGAGDRAYMTWAAQAPWGGGCADADPDLPKPGTYFATDATGAWHVRRLSSIISPASLVVDAQTGRVNTVLDGTRALREYVRAPKGAWTNRSIPRTLDMGDTVIRRDPSTGVLLLVGVQYMGERTAVVAMTKR